MNGGLVGEFRIKFGRIAIYSNQFHRIRGGQLRDEDVGVVRAGTLPEWWKKCAVGEGVCGSPRTGTRATRSQFSGPTTWSGGAGRGPNRVDSHWVARPGPVGYRA